MGVSAPRTVSINLFANVSQFEEAFIRAGMVAESTSTKIKGSAKAAGDAAAAQAKAMGASSSEQSAAAGKAAAAFVEANSKISSSSKAAGDAAMSASKKVGASLEEQRAAYVKAIATQAEYEDSTKKAADAAEASAARQAAAAKKMADSHASAVSKISSLGKYTLGGAAVGAVFAVKGAADLQSQMERIHTQAGASQKQVQALTGSVLKLAPATGQGPQVLADGMYHVVSSLNATTPAAQRVSKEYNVLQAAAEGAKVGNANLVDVTNALDATVVAGMPGVKNYKQAMGELNSTVGAGDMTMQNLADALGTGILGPMKTYGLTVKDVGGALAVFGDNNIRGQDAATKLNSAIRIMAAPSIAASKALGAVNVSTLQLANDMRQGGIVQALEDLKKHLIDSGATASQQALVITRAFGGRQSTGIQLLLNQLDRLKAKTDQVGKGAGTFGADWQATQKTVSFQFDQMKAEVQALGDKIGAKLIPVVDDAVGALKSIAAWLEKNQGVAKDLAIAIGTVLGGAVIIFATQKAASFISSVGNMGKAIGGIATKMSGTAGVMASEGTAIVASADSTEAGVDAAMTGTGTSITGVGTKMTATAGVVSTEGKAMVGAADTAEVGVDAALGSTGIGLAIVGLSLAATELATHWHSIMDDLKKDAQSIVTPIENAFNKITGAASSTGSNIPPGLAHVSANGQMIGGTHNVQYGAGIKSVPKGMSATGLTGGENSMARKLMDMLMTEGNLSPAGAAAVVGNWTQESSLNPNLTGASGLGLAQWMGSRRTNEQSFAKSQMQPSNSPYAQVLFALHELQSNPALLKELRGTHNAGAAAVDFEKVFEAAGNPQMSKRVGYAQSLIAAFRGAGASSSVHHASAAAAALAKQPGLSAAAKKALGLDGSNSATGSTTAAATSTIPVAVATMLATAQGLIGTRYTSGGGHNGWDPVAELKKIGVDCSGFVSQVLHAGGVTLPGPLTTEGLAANLKPGKGSAVTVYDRATGAYGNQHTLIDILGKYFMSGGSTAVNPSSQVVQLTAAKAAQELAGGGFKAYHPTYSGKLATDKQLRAMGVSGLSGFSGQTTDIANLVATAHQNSSAARQTLLSPLRSVVDSYIKSMATARGGHHPQLASIDQKALGSVLELEGKVPGARAIGNMPKSKLDDLKNALHNDLVKIISNSDTALAYQKYEVAANKKQQETVTKAGAAAQKMGTYQADAEIKATVVRTAANNKWLASEKALDTRAHTLTGTYQSATQSGTLASLGRRLGFSSSPLVSIGQGGPGRRESGPGGLSSQTVGQRLTALVHGMGDHASMTSIQRRLGGVVSRGLGGSANQKYESQVAGLIRDGQTKEAAQLVAAHKAAMASFTLQAYAQQALKDGELLKQQATALNDQTTAIQNAASSWATTNQAVQQKANDTSSAVVQRMTDMQARTNDASSATVQSMTDMQQITDDTMTGMATAISDLSNLRSDQGQGVIDAINDQTQVQVDTIGERGLYGLALVAQKLQVEADITKAYWDQQIDLAKQQVDLLQLQADQSETIAQVNLDQVTLQQDANVGQAQNNLDTVTIAQNALVAAAQNNVDTITIAQDQRIATAQAHADAVQLHADATLIGPAQTALDMNASASKAQQAVYQAQLNQATGLGGYQTAGANQALAVVQGTAAKAIQDATDGFQNVSNTAAQAIQAATDGFQNTSNIAAQTIQAASDNYKNTTDYFTTALAGASSNLQSVTTAGGIAEAGTTSAAQLASATAATQFAGSGLVVNVYNPQSDNASAIGQEVSWAVRTSGLQTA